MLVEDNMDGKPNIIKEGNMQWKLLRKKVSKQNNKKYIL
jgi:hypothetical protein